MRLTLGVIPLIGIADGVDETCFSRLAQLGIDDIIFSDISKEDLFRKIYSLSDAKEKMYSSFLVKDALGDQKNKKVAILSEEKMNIFDNVFKRNSQINIWII